MDTREVATDLYSLIQKLVRQLRTRGRTSELTSERLSALLHLNNNGHSSIKELATLEQVAHSTMSRLVSGLTSDGLALAHTNGLDRRTSAISLTPKGKRAAAKTLSRVTDPLADAIAKLSRSEQADLVRGIQVMESLLGDLSK